MVVTNFNNPDFSKFRIKPFKSKSELQNPLCLEAFTYWDALKTEGRLADFDLIAIPRAISHVVVVELLDNGKTMVFRMNGQLIVEASGQDLTGQRFAVGEDKAPLAHKFCRAVLDHKTSVMSSDGFSATLANQPVYFDETIGLPIFDSDGNIDRIVLVYGLGRDPSKEK